MAYINGDALISGAILSFQQVNRMKDNWRAAAAISNPQAGMLQSISVGEKLYHRQAAAWKEIVQWDTTPTLSGLNGPAGDFLINSAIIQDIKLWSTIASGNPWLYAYGWDTGESAVKYGRFSVKSDGRLYIDAENEYGHLGVGDVYGVRWSASDFRLSDDIAFVFGANDDICMGYLDTGDIFHICDGGTVGTNKLISIKDNGLGFFGVTPATQPAAIPDATGPGNIVDRCNDALAALRTLGLIAT